MAHVFLADGRRLRVRLFPSSSRQPRKRRADTSSLSLFEPPTEDSHDTAAERLAARIVEFCLLNRNNAIILEKFPQLGLRDWWLASGCLFQTVWNLKCGNPAHHNIEDYDVCYFSEDDSWEAENDVIQSAEKLFSDLGVVIQVRNQARVHKWFPEKYGLAYPPLTTASEGILRFPASAQTIGMKRTGDKYIDVYAPFGLGDIWEMIVRPNRALPASVHYAEKTEKWRAKWPDLKIYPWGESRPEKTT